MDVSGPDQPGLHARGLGAERRRRDARGLPHRGRVIDLTSWRGREEMDLGTDPHARGGEPRADLRPELRPPARQRRPVHADGRARLPIQEWAELAHGRRLGREVVQRHLPRRPERESGLFLVLERRHGLVERQVRADARLRPRGLVAGRRSLEPPGMSAQRSFALALVGGIVLSLSGMFLGWWWVTFATGVVIGLALPRTWTALLAGAISGLVAWSEPLIEANAQYGLGPTSLSIAAIMGANGAALIPVFLTVIVGGLLGLTGSWLGTAIRGFTISRPRSRLVEKLGDQRLEVKDPVLTER